MNLVVYIHEGMKKQVNFVCSLIDLILRTRNHGNLLRIVLLVYGSVLFDLLDTFFLSLIKCVFVTILT